MSSKGRSVSPVTPSVGSQTLSSALGISSRKFKRGDLIVANFDSALESLWANRMRSLLTALGIFIGVAAVISALTLTQGASASINARISSLGTNLITISPGTSRNVGVFGGVGTTQSLTVADELALARVPHVTAVSPIISLTAQVVYGNQNWNTRVQGVDTEYQTIQSWDLAAGLWFSTSQETAGSPVAVLGQTVVHSLFDATGTNPIGQSIRIRDQLFRVVGVLQSKGTQGAANADDIIFVPFTAALSRLKNSIYVDQIQAQVDNGNDVTQAQQDITAILERRHQIVNGAPDDFQAFNSNQLLQTAQQLTQTLTILLVGIAGISLTVGGIGIMNIMLVSVTERTREIGIRMSVGARRKDIRNQFLIEALALSFVGGVVGMCIGLLVGFAITHLAQIPFVVSPTSILAPFIISGVIGVVFGLYPAVRASRLDPIVALHTE